LLLKKRAINTRAGQRSYLKMPLLDSTGQPIDLTEYGIADGVGNDYLQYALSGNAGPLSDLTGKAYVATRYTEAAAGGTTAQVTAAALDASAGLIMCEVPTLITDKPGVFLAESAILAKSGMPIYSNEIYVYNERSAWSTGGMSMPALDEMRLSLRDNDPAENELINNFDFGLPELCYAITRTVRYWNAQPPPVGFTDTRGGLNSEIWMLGTQLFLFEMAEEHYRRNRLPYAAGQTQVDDKAKEENYNKAYQDRMQRFRQLVMHEKARINISRGFGSLGGYYGSSR
jgi:hypothetical protein